MGIGNNSNIGDHREREQQRSSGLTANLNELMLTKAGKILA